MDLVTMVRRLRSQGITPKAVGYARFSSVNQEGNMSIQAQTRAIREFAEKNGVVLVKEYIDRAQSATSDDREEFQQMIKDSNSCDWQFIFVHKLDRFARNRVDSAGYRVKLAKNGVMLVSTLESYDPDSPEGALMEGLAELMAEFYSKNLSREIKKGQKENALEAKFCGGTPPLGYDVDPVTKKYVINEEEAAAVRMIFSMIAQNYTYGCVLKTLYSRDFKTKRGANFRQNSLHDILRNPKYMGLYFYRRLPSTILGQKAHNSHKYNAHEDMILVENGVPEIISKELFERVQTILDRRKKVREVHHKKCYLLAGRIHCGMCGMAYSGFSHKGAKRDVTYYTYRCAGTKKVKEERCTNGMINSDLMEKQVLKYLAEVVFNTDSIPKVIAKYRERIVEKSKENAVLLKHLRKQELDVGKKIENILSLIEGGEGNQILLKRLDELEKQKIEISAKISQEEKKIDVHSVDPDKLKALFERAKVLLKDGSLYETKRLIEMFVDTIIVNERNVVIRLNTTAFALKDAGVVIEKVIDRNEVRLHKKKFS